MMVDMKDIDMGNNEIRGIGIGENTDGTFTALTLSQSKTFRTRRGAESWLARRGYRANGNRA